MRTFPPYPLYTNKTYTHVPRERANLKTHLRDLCTSFAKVDPRVVRNSHGTWMWLCFAAEVAVHAWRQVGEVIGSWLSPLPCIPEAFVIVSPFASGMMRTTSLGDAKSGGQTVFGDPHKICVKYACDATWITNTKTAHSPRKKPQERMWRMVLQSTQLRRRSKACQVC